MPTSDIVDVLCVLDVSVLIIYRARMCCRDMMISSETIRPVSTSLILLDR